VRVEHGLVDACVGAAGTLEGLGAGVVAHVVVQVVLELRDERAARARQHLLGLDVRARVRPELVLGVRVKLALLAPERLRFALNTKIKH